MQLQLSSAQVISLIDNSLIKIKLLPQMLNVDNKDELYPIAYPFISHNNSNENIEIGSTVWVLHDPLYQIFYYLGNRYFQGLINGKWDTVSSKLSSVSELSNCDYSNMIWTLEDNGNIKFENKSTSDVGILHKTGTYEIINSSGNITIYHCNGTIIEINDDVNINATGKLSFGNSSNTLQALLLELIDDLSQLTTVGSPASHSSPTLTAQMTVLKQELQQVFN